MAFEVAGVGLAHVGRNLHAGQHDLGAGAAAAHRVDDALQVVAGGGEGQAAQAVVATQLQHEYIHGLLQNPAHAAAAAGSGFAAQAGVNDFVAQFERVDFVANKRGEGLFGLDAVAGREAVAEEQQALGGRGGSGRRGGGRVARQWPAFRPWGRSCRR